jgi:hypothetical protein
MRPASHSGFALSQAPGQSAGAPAHQARAKATLLQHAQLSPGAGELERTVQTFVRPLFFRRPHTEPDHGPVGFGFYTAVALTSAPQEPGGRRKERDPRPGAGHEYSNYPKNDPITVRHTWIFDSRWPAVKTLFGSDSNVGARAEFNRRETSPGAGFGKRGGLVFSRLRNTLWV